MSRMPQITVRDLVRFLRAHGFVKLEITPQRFQPR